MQYGTHATLSPAILILPLAVTIAAAVFWVWMLRDMLNNSSLTPNERYTWILSFVFLSIFAAGYYYFTVYRQR
jgi:uncharacterized RDD family membrane protein YckC